MALKVNIKIGKREKIVGGLLIMLVFIGIIHMILYQPKSRQLTEINQTFNQAMLRYQDVSSKNLPREELDSIAARVEHIENLFLDGVNRLEIGKEREIDAPGDAFLRKLEEFRNLEQTSTQPRISILEGWQITEDIPGLEPTRIPDLLNQLKQTKSILALPNISPELNEKFNRQYLELLQRLGFNKSELEEMSPFIAWLKQFKMLDYIRNHKGGADIKDDMELLTILDIPLYDAVILETGMFFLIRTEQIIQLAKQSGLESISNIQLLEARDIRPVVKEAPEPTTPTPSAELFGEFGGDMAIMGGELGMMEGPMGEMMDPRSRFFPGMMRQAEPTPPPEAEPPSAISIPIQVTVVGDNIALANFLYYVTHSPRLMDIREMDISADVDGKMTAIITINFYRNVRGVNIYMEQVRNETENQGTPN